ncbi:MAG TPA: FtsX-like permease family protein, partial [Puia sp.]|nr:FtsX-like permease family protein [Puia sp.]
AAGDKVVKMSGYFAGADFFSMFSYPLLAGSARQSLDKPNSIAISERMAQIFFGSSDKAIGKMLRFDNSEDLKVSSIFANIPNHSSLHFDFVRSWIDYVKQNSWVHNWGNTSPSTVVQLRNNANPTEVEEKIKNFVYNYTGQSAGWKVELGLQPYKEKYLHSNFKNGYVSGGRIEYVRLFTVVAIFILLIACINFMNLATARATKRAKEVGLRKVIGALRSSLIGQFIGEALIFTFLSFAIAWSLTIIILPAFNHLTEKQMSIPWQDLSFWEISIGLFFATGIIAGSYPALFLSSLKPISVLKGTLRFNWSATFFRKTLVVFQFALTIILIVSMIVTYR